MCSYSVTDLVRMHMHAHKCNKNDQLGMVKQVMPVWSWPNFMVLCMPQWYHLLEGFIAHDSRKHGNRQTDRQTHTHTHTHTDQVL